jgi:hypothetical protein
MDFASFFSVDKIDSTHLIGSIGTICSTPCTHNPCNSIRWSWEDPPSLHSLLCHSHKRPSMVSLSLPVKSKKLPGKTKTDTESLINDILQSDTSTQSVVVTKQSVASALIPKLINVSLKSRNVGNVTLELSCIPSFLDLWISFFGETAARNVQLKGTLGSSENGDDSPSLKVLNSMADNGNMQTNLESLELEIENPSAAGLVQLLLSLKDGVLTSLVLHLEQPADESLLGKIGAAIDKIGQLQHLDMHSTSLVLEEPMLSQVSQYSGWRKVALHLIQDSALASNVVNSSVVCGQVTELALLECTLNSTSVNNLKPLLSLPSMKKLKLSDCTRPTTVLSRP